MRQAETMIDQVTAFATDLQAYDEAAVESVGLQYAYKNGERGQLTMTVVVGKVTYVATANTLAEAVGKLLQDLRGRGKRRLADLEEQVARLRRALGE